MATMTMIVYLRMRCDDIEEKAGAFVTGCIC